MTMMIGLYLYEASVSNMRSTNISQIDNDNKYTKHRSLMAYLSLVFQVFISIKQAWQASEC